MTDLEAETLLTITNLWQVTIRMREIIIAIRADRGGSDAALDSVRHWLLLNDACTFLLDCIEKTAEFESMRESGQEKIDLIELELRLRAEAARQDHLPKGPKIE